MPDYEFLDSENKVIDFVAWANKEPFVVLDIETTGLDSFKDEVIDIQLGNEVRVGIFDLTSARPLSGLSSLPVLHYGKFDVTFLYRKGLDLTRLRYRDTMLMGHLVDENRESYSLDAYVKEIWNDTYKEEFWGRYKSYQEAPKEEGWAYGAKDVRYTARLFKYLGESLKRESIPDSLVEHTHRLQMSLLQTEIHGVSVDTDYLLNLGIDLKAEVESLKPRMKELAKDYIEVVELDLWGKAMDKLKTDKAKARVPRPEFSFDSPKQLVSLLYGEMGLPPQRNDKTKSVSVDDSCLEKVKEAHPLVPLIQKYRGVQKVLSVYVDGTTEKIRDGKIYPSFRVHGTKTGRISHSDPNLGQLPKTGGVRGIYRPKKGHVFISADYSQLEVCIEANLTGDPQLARIFTQGLKKHSVTATELSLDYETAKTLNFALQYWASHFKVAKLLGVSEKRGKEIWESYWALYSGPKRLKGITDSYVDSGKPIVTGFGRRRRFEVRKRSDWDSDYRQAYNFLIQGTGADITSRAFYLTSEWLTKMEYGRGLFSVHDELIIEVKEQFVEQAEKGMLTFMAHVGEELGLKIPLKAESSGGMERWCD